MVSRENIEKKYYVDRVDGNAVYEYWVHLDDDKIAYEVRSEAFKFTKIKKR